MRIVEITPADSIQANMDAIANEGGGKLIVTPGDYHETGSIHLRRGVQIEGVGEVCTPALEDAPVKIFHEPKVAIAWGGAGMSTDVSALDHRQLRGVDGHHHPIIESDIHKDLRGAAEYSRSLKGNV